MFIVAVDVKMVLPGVSSCNYLLEGIHSALSRQQVEVLVPMKLQLQILKFRAKITECGAKTVRFLYCLRLVWE